MHVFQLIKNLTNTTLYLLYLQITNECKYSIKNKFLDVFIIFYTYSVHIHGMNII